MFHILKIIYGYINITYNVILFKIYGLPLLDDEDFIKKIINSVELCGCMMIKLVQWSLPRIQLLYDTEYKIFNKLNIFYEKCGIHNLTYTNDIFYKEFGYSLDSKYDNIEIIGSGSIGQVYKVRNKNTKHIYALKVNHPHLYMEYYIFKYTLLLIIRIIKITDYVPVYDINKFINNLKLQLDLNNECNNNLQQHELYSDRSLIVIPKIYYSSKDILLMEYINGSKLSYNEIGIYNYNKMSIALSIFSISSAIYGFNIHGDLHEGNYKVMQDNNKYKLIIYDFGYCFRICKYEYNIIDEVINNPIYEKYLRNFINFYLNKEYNSGLDKNYIIDTFNKEIVTYMVSQSYITTSDTIKILYRFFLKYNVLFSIDILNILLLFLHIHQTIKDTSLIDNTSSKHNDIKEDIINICNVYNISPLFVDYLNNCNITKLDYKPTYDISQYDLKKYI